MPSHSRPRPIKNINMELFDQDLHSLDWISISASRTVDEMVGLFQYFLLLLFDRHAPVKHVTIKPDKSFPWVTETLRQMMQLRNQSLCKYRSTKSETDKASWKDLQVMVKTCMDTEKRAFFNHSVNSQVHNGRSFWKSLQRNVLVDPRQDSALPHNFNDLLEEDTLRALIEEDDCETDYMNTEEESEVEADHISADSNTDSEVDADIPSSNSDSDDLPLLRCNKLVI
ncbi:hypothetical protein ACJJTC_002533 [Scirpophaga incertulas]